MKYFINAKFQTFAFEDSDTAEFISGYAQPDWMQIANLPIETPAPAFDPLTQSVIRDGCEQVDGEWQYRWRIDGLFATQVERDEAIAANKATAQVAKWDAIKSERDRRTQTGGYFVAPHWYHSDTFSRTQQIGLVMLGTNIQPGTIWKTLDNGLISMTQTLAGHIFGAAAANDIAIFKAAETHKSGMMASADPAAYDFSGGWPEMYEGAA